MQISQMLALSGTVYEAASYSLNRRPNPVLSRTDARVNQIHQDHFGGGINHKVIIISL